MECFNPRNEEKVNQIKSLDKYKKLKSDYFLQTVFNNLEKKKSFGIIKYNKNIKKRINISIKDYKEFSENYSSIELEIKPANNKFGQFINIKDEDKIYYHIYFNNNKEETNRNFINKDEQIKIIKIIIAHQIKSFERLFENCKCIKSIYFKRFFRNNINNMSYMFCECSLLKELNLNNFNTNNVNDMSNMFKGCSLLKELNLNNFNTNNVTDMNSMFFGCSSLKELNLNNFNTDNVTDMNFMFNGCSSLKELNLNNFNTNNLIYMNCMFSGCSNELILKIKTQYKNLKEEAFKNN